MANGNGVKRAHAEPTKDFFIRMITRDISLRDCIVDLLDNSVDGARRTAKIATPGVAKPSLAGFDATIRMSNDEFSIKDNCGGISLGDAVDYAFHFGRRKDAPKDVEGTIGLYGIGMKRAIFKIGRKARIESRHKDDRFVVVVDVDTWETQTDKEGRQDWDFNIDALEDAQPIGTSIVLSALYPTVAASFTDPTFSNELIRTIARDYAFVIQQGFKVNVGEVAVPDYGYRIKQSADLAPGVIEYEDNGVKVRIVAGLIEELDVEVPDELKPEKTERFGWYVICNDRVILAADTSEHTVWGNAGFQVWHSQYNGFAGFLFLSADEPDKLPWTTTKREVDVGNPIYLRAVVKMKELTKLFIAYTNERKVDPDAARLVEASAPSVGLETVKTAAPIRFPTISAPSTGVEYTTIQYRRPKAEIKKVAKALGNASMAAREVGRRTFEYFKKMELGE